MEMENHLEKDDGCYDNAEAAFSDDEEELNSKGEGGAPGIPQGHGIPTTLEDSQLPAQLPPRPGADPAGRSLLQEEELIPRFQWFWICSQRVHSLSWLFPRSSEHFFSLKS